MLNCCKLMPYHEPEYDLKCFSLSHICGVPQEPILGPLLCGIFINDLPLCLSPKSVKCDLFAVDGTLRTANDIIKNIFRD